MQVDADDVHKSVQARPASAGLLHFSDIKLRYGSSNTTAPMSEGALISASKEASA